ncbi:MAG: ZIP family metal transporter [Bacteroidota bacterium]|jgi:zinc and cadmium transporter
MNTIESAIMFVTVSLGGMLFFTIRNVNQKILKLSLAFTGAFLFSLSLTHLLPTVFSHDAQNAGIFILAGFFLQLVLEYFTEGVEHGHEHHHNHHGKSFPLAMMVGLCIHSFLEGMPLSGHFDTHDHGHSLLAGIILHHLPVAFVLVSMLMHSGIGRTWSIVNLLLFAAMAPIGAWFSGMLSETELMNIGAHYDKIMGLVIGIFLHISTTILFESGSGHRFNLYKLSVILLGAIAALLL